MNIRFMGARVDMEVFSQVGKRHQHKPLQYRNPKYPNTTYPLTPPYRASSRSASASAIATTWSML